MKYHIVGQQRQASAVSPLLSLLPLPWYLIHSCSLPCVICYFIFDLVCDFINYSTFIQLFQEVKYDIGAEKF